MSREAYKSKDRRLKNGDFDKYFVGFGLDIGAGKSPVLPECDIWDRPQGDAQYLKGVPDQHYDWVHSSHCLEHTWSPETAIENWWRVLKGGGYMIITVPDFFLYEKKHLPSIFNRDHKWAFTIKKIEHPKIIAVSDLFKMSDAQILRVQLNEDGFDYKDTVTDQTLGRAQSEIEIIVRKQKDTFWSYF